MKILYADYHNQIMALPVGESLVFDNLDGRTLSDLRGEINYFFQGTLKEHDNRLNDPNFPHDLSWDWRIEDTFDRNEDDRHLWDLKVTKVETPDKWRYSGVERGAIVEKQRLEARLIVVNDKLEAIAAAKQPKK